MSSGGAEIGRVTPTSPNQSEEVELRSTVDRTNRVRATYNNTCTGVVIEVLERHQYMCFDFSRDPCARLPDQNCESGLSWTFNSQTQIISDRIMCSNP